MGAGHIASQLAVFGSIIVLAALVPPSSFGTVAAATVMVNVAILLMDAGTRGRIITSAALSREEVTRSVATNVAIALVVALVVAVLAGPIVDAFADGGDPRVVRALFLSIVTYAFAIVPLALLQKELSFKKHAAVTAAAAFVAAFVGVLAGVLGAGVWALVLRQVLSTTLLAAFAWIAARGLVTRLQVGRARAGAAPRRARLVPRPRDLVFLVAAAHFAAFNVDNLIIGALGGAEDLGLYALAFMIAFAFLSSRSPGRSARSSFQPLPWRAIPESSYGGPRAPCASWRSGLLSVSYPRSRSRRSSSPASSATSGRTWSCRSRGSSWRASATPS